MKIDITWEEINILLDALRTKGDIILMGKPLPEGKFVPLDKERSQSLMAVEDLFAKIDRIV